MVILKRAVEVYTILTNRCHQDPAVALGEGAETLAARILVWNDMCRRFTAECFDFLVAEKAKSTFKRACDYGLRT
jgi:hypothetical protein